MLSVFLGLLVAQSALGFPLENHLPRAINPKYQNGTADADDRPALVEPRAINPIYQNVSVDEVYKRADSGPLYGSSGKPVMTDVHQTTNPSCGFASTMAAVVNVASGWISEHVTYTGSVGSVSSATVTLYDTTTLAAKKFTISCAETASKSDVDPSTGVWWPGLYDHAAVELGMSNQNGALGPIYPSDALMAITGLKASGKSITSADQIWDYAQETVSKKTPIILQTKQSGCTTLVCGHAYALLSGSGSGSSRTITLYNPWGQKVTNSLAETMADAYYMWYLVNKDTYTGEVNTVQTSTKAANPTTTSAKPTETEDNVVWVTEVVTVYVTA